MSVTWRQYEDLAQHILSYFSDQIGISTVEGKQRIEGESGTTWEIDAKAISDNGVGFLVVECKERSSRKLSQSVIGALAYTIQDTGANGGIIITSIGLQEGAEKVAKHEGIRLVYIASESTFESWLAECGNSVIFKPKPLQLVMRTACTGAIYTKIK